MENLSHNSQKRTNYTREYKPNEKEMNNENKKRIMQIFALYIVHTVRNSISKALSGDKKIHHSKKKSFTFVSENEYLAEQID